METHSSKIQGDILLKYPLIIQGGMGAGVSSWHLANTVSRLGQLGVISGTALDLILVRRLQDGDPGGHMRRAMDHFPVPEIADRVYLEYYIEGGRAPDQPYKLGPLFTIDPSPELQELTVMGNFVEVWLAKEGHQNPVGMNLMEKIQMPNLLSIYGAMLAGIDYILMGAGIPREIPGVLDKFVNHEKASIRIDVKGALSGEHYETSFDPCALMQQDMPPLRRPVFLAIISSNTLAMSLVKKANGRVDGFVIEGPTAGGHNAPPRGNWEVNEKGEPIYGPRDVVDLEKILEMGLPYWIAGSTGCPLRIKELQEQGATGAQVGTLFAFCEESALAEDLKKALINKAINKEGVVFTDPIASPTGFPFKVAMLEGTLSDKAVYDARQRICDLGYLRHAYRKQDGSLGYRCPAEEPDVYTAKGGKREETVGRKCLCNSLMANIGHNQVQRDGYVEKALVTVGDDLNKISRFVSKDKPTYTAREVLEYLLSEV
jgi:nitronate monooxygenase